MTTIVLHWHQVSDMRLEAQHEGTLFVITKRPNYDRHPCCDNEYQAMAYVGAMSVDLGKFVNDSASAKRKCGEFVNSNAGSAP